MTTTAATPRLFALVLPLVAILGGALIAFGEMQAMIICLSLIAAAFVLRDYRLGVVALIVMMPLAASTMFPRNIAGITGLNPMNLLLAGTLVSCVFQRQSARLLARITPRQLIWLYVAPFMLAGLIGSAWVDEIPWASMAVRPVAFDDVTSYLLLSVIRPLLLVLFALLVAAAVAQSQNHGRILAALLVSIALMSLITIRYVAIAGVGLDAMAGDMARGVLSPLGLHANDLGRLYMVGYALLLFTLAETRDNRLRLALGTTLLLTVVALALTFSRAAFIGFIFINLWFALTRGKLITVLLALTVMLALGFLLPDAVFTRMTFGWDVRSGDAADVISAGRVASLWLPLLPEVLNSPIFGHGLGSILWSDAMHAGTIIQTGHPHNAFLETLLDMGILGLGLVLAFYLHVWRGFKHLSRHPGLSAEQRGFFAGAGAALGGFFIAGVAGSSLVPVPEQVFLWLAIGMLYGTLYRLRPSSPGEQP